MVRRVYLIVLCLLLSVPLLTAALPAVQEKTGDLVAEIKIMAKALGAIQEAYVGETKPRQLVYEAIKGMLASLGDRYAQFFDPKTYELLQMHMKGEYAGIGAVLKIMNEYPVVLGLKPGSAAQKAGIKTRDRILEIDGTLVKGMALPEVAAMLRGEAESNVDLLLQRGAKALKITVTREKIELESVQDIHQIEPGLGYLKIANFRENTTAQVDKAIQDLEKQKKLKGLIIDLRDNNGGLLEQAVGLAGLFLKPGTKVVSVKSRIAVQQKDHFTEEGHTVYPVKLAVLVNGKSASASEVFSACLQDHKRAMIVGTQTFGKASVQSVVPLDEKTGMKFTTARYLSPLGRMIDGKGIAPDEIVEQGKRGDPQLEKARKLLK